MPARAIYLWCQHHLPPTPRHDDIQQSNHAYAATGKTNRHGQTRAEVLRQLLGQTSTSNRESGLGSLGTIETATRLYSCRKNSIYIYFTFTSDNYWNNIISRIIMESKSKLNFVNHITEMSMKVAKPIGLLYKRNRFPPETILKTVYTSLIHP